MSRKLDSIPLKELPKSVSTNARRILSLSKKDTGSTRGNDKAAKPTEDEARATEKQSSVDNGEPTNEVATNPTEAEETVVEEPLSAVEIEGLHSKGNEYVADNSKRIDNLKYLCGNQSMADLMPTPFVKTMVFWETISYQDTLFVYDLASSIKNASDAERKAIKEHAPLLDEWFTGISGVKNSKADQANAKEKAGALADCIGSFLITSPLPPITVFKDALARGDIDQYYPYTKKQAPTPEKRKELLKGHRDIWIRVKEAFEITYYGTTPFDPKTRYPKIWEKVIAFARVRQLSLGNHELDIQRFRIKMEECLGFLPGINGSSPSNAKGKSTSTQGPLASINTEIKKNKAEMRKMQAHFDKLSYSWA